MLLGSGSAVLLTLGDTELMSPRAVSVHPEAASHSILHPLSDVNIGPTLFGIGF